MSLKDVKSDKSDTARNKAKKMDAVDAGAGAKSGLGDFTSGASAASVSTSTTKPKTHYKHTQAKKRPASAAQGGYGEKSDQSGPRVGSKKKKTKLANNNKK